MNFNFLVPHFPLVDPVINAFISQGFGKERTAASVLHWYKELGLDGHNGLDYKVAYVPCYAVFDGDVISSGIDNSGGKYIKYQTNPISIPEGEFKLQFIYYHLDSIKVKAGERVKKGQNIGVTGNSGFYTTGPHLHFGLKPYYKNQQGRWQRDYNNGYKGAINPLPFFISQGNKPLTNYKTMTFFKSRNDSKVYGQLGGQFIWLNMDFEQFNRNFPNNQIVELSDEEFSKFPISSLKVTI